MLNTHKLPLFGVALVAACSARPGPSTTDNTPSPSQGDNGSPSGVIGSVQGGGINTGHDIVVAPQVAPSSIRLGDGTTLTGDPIRIQILGGENPVVQVSIAASEGPTSWTLISTVDMAMFKTGNLVTSITQSATRPGVASVQRWVSQISTAASSGVVSLAKNSAGNWVGTVKTDQDGISATITAGATVTCFVPVEQLGTKPNGNPGPGVGGQMAADVTFQSSFCSQFK